ncbi:hypothetical protein G6L37_35005 [Agrobacterium rubi]|nr:hypothetical protein [Agrobacterium rubi]NTF23779.1 hypothetical protein [Agrobacterium rubi]
MSAFFVTDKTIADAVQCMTDYGLEQDDLPRDLWRLNVEALVQRYDYPAEKFENAILGYSSPTPSADPYQVLKSANCLIYQCSEGNVPEMPLFKSLSEAAEDLSARLGGPDTGNGRDDRDARYDAAKWDRDEDVPAGTMKP